MRRIVALVAAAVLAGVVGNAGNITTAGAQDGSERQGVTSKEIKIGGIASPPSILNVPYQDGFAGAKAYFDLVNKKGGVFGRDLKMVAQLSDQGAPSGNIRAVRSLNEQKKVFAILPIETNSFAGGKYIDDNKVPAFGYNIDAGYCGTQPEVLAIEDASIDIAGPSGSFPTCPRKTIFGEKGSFLCFKCPSIAPAIIAKEKGLKTGAIFTYSHPSSTACGDGTRATFEKYGIKVGFEDRSLQFGFTDASADVEGVKNNNVDFIATCMDFGGAYKISQELRQAGVTGLTFYAPEGYRQETIEKYGKQLDGWVFGTLFVPWEGKQLPKATKQYLKAMKDRGIKPSEQSQAGWMNAQLLVEGIKRAGKDFTRSSVVAAINAITVWDNKGMTYPISWAGDARGPGREACGAFVEAKNGKFKPIIGKPGQPFVCYPDNPQPDNLDTPYYRPLKPGEPDPVASAP
jgi:ABC-type branched-subunit amino acid transport system substrate-binding protein